MERQDDACLVEDAAIVRRDVMSIEEESFLHCQRLVMNACKLEYQAQGVMVVDPHRLKLVTGVDISARPVRRSGRRAKARNSRKRSAAAAA